MTVLLFASSASAYVFSGMVCYLASISGYNQYSESAEKVFTKGLGKLWITALWPVWMLGEIAGDDGKTETLAVNPIVCSDSEKI